MIGKALRLFCPEDGIIEIRTLRGNQPVHSGYLDHNHLHEAAEEIEKLDQAYLNLSGIYITFNEINPALLARRVNRITRLQKGDSTTSDADIVRRRWFMIDLDPNRPAGISSSDEEKRCAFEKLEEVRAYLDDRFGGIAPVIGDSGNGWHLLYRIDLEPLPENDHIIKSALEHINNKFGDDRVKIDLTVANRSRLTRLYGTMNRKGDHTEDRPHRQSGIISIPENLQIVPREALASLAGEKKQPTTSSQDAGFKLSDWMITYGKQLPEYEEKTRPGFQAFYEFKICPWNNSHTDGAAWVGQLATGPIAAGCHHDGCAGQDWHSLRAMVEPPKPEVDLSEIMNRHEEPTITEDEFNAQIRNVTSSQSLKLETHLPEDHFISQCVRYGSRLSDAYTDYHVGNALMLLSTATSKKPYINLSFGPIFCNIWIFGLGRSTSSRKTTAMKWCSQIIRDMGLMGPSSYSPEALIERIAETPYMVLLKDEAGALLASMQKPYMADIRDIFCSLYECDGIDRQLRTKPRGQGKTSFKVEETFINCYYMTTFESFLKYATGLDVTSGWLYRFLYVAPNYYRSKRPFQLSAGCEEEARIFITDWIMKLFNLFRDLEPFEIAIEPEAWNYYQAWQMKLEDDIDRRDDETSSAMFGRVSTAALKIAALFTIGDAAYKIGNRVTSEYMIEACRVCEDYFLPAGIEIVNQINDHGNQNLQEKIIRELKKRGGHIDHAFLLQLMRKPADEFRKAIATLEETGEIERVSVENPGKKNKMIYILKRNESHFRKDREVSKKSKKSKVSNVSNVSNVSVSSDDANITNTANFTNFPTLPNYASGIDIGHLLKNLDPEVRT